MEIFNVCAKMKEEGDDPEPFYYILEGTTLYAPWSTKGTFFA
jgi:hypothetical protein